MTEEPKLEKKVREEDITWSKYIAWVEYRDNPKLQEDALKILQDALEKKPKDWNILTRLAYVSSYIKNYSSALEYADKALELRRDDIRILQMVLDFYDGIYRDNPVFSYKHGLTGKKLKIRRAIWEIQNRGNSNV